MKPGRKRENIALTLPGCIFQTLRSIGVSDTALSEATGIPRPNITRVCAGTRSTIDMSAEEFARLQDFAAQKEVEARAAVALLGARAA